MKLSKEDLVKIIREVVLPDKDFQEALKITRNNSSGKTWLIGGFLYKNIAHVLYGSKKTTKDFDLVIERAVPDDKIVLPKGWELTMNRFNNPKFSDGEREIDFIPLERIHWIKTRGLQPSIENYLAGEILNVACLAYCIDNKEILGDVGIKALEEKIVRVHDLEMLEYGAKLHGITSNAMIQKKARELGFVAELI